MGSGSGGDSGKHISQHEILSINQSLLCGFSTLWWCRERIRRWQVQEKKGKLAKKEKKKTSNLCLWIVATITWKLASIELLLLLLAGDMGICLEKRSSTICRFKAKSIGNFIYIVVLLSVCSFCCVVHTYFFCDNRETNYMLYKY